VTRLVLWHIEHLFYLNGAVAITTDYVYMYT